VKIREGFLAAALVAGFAGTDASAQPLEKVTLGTTAIGLWDTSQPTFCKDRGEFAKAGLDVEILSTRGGSELVQAVIGGGVDIGYSPGTNAVLAAFNRGANIKIVGSEFTGQAGAFFYVPADSPIKTVQDLNGKTIAFSRPGGAMESILLGFKNENHLSVKPVATGAMDATYTMTMTKQVDVGYSVVPNLLEAIEDNKIRVLFKSDDVVSMRELTGRVNIANGDFLKNRRSTAIKFFEVLDKCIDWGYGNLPDAAKRYAARALDFYKRENLVFGPLVGLDAAMKQAIEEKFLEKPLTPEQISNLMDIIYITKK
jgi:NitT/TauT family transport system substrate-binding protein